MDENEKIELGLSLFVFVAMMPKQTRRIFNRYIFKSAKEEADSRDEVCKKNFIACLFEYFDKDSVLRFLFHDDTRKVNEANEYLESNFNEFYDRYSSCFNFEFEEKTYDTFLVNTYFDNDENGVSPHDFMENYRTVFEQIVSVAEKDNLANTELPDFSKIGYLQFINDDNLFEHQGVSLGYNMYCLGELTSDILGFIYDDKEPVQKRISVKKLLVDYCKGSHCKLLSQKFHDEFEEIKSVKASLMNVENPFSVETEIIETTDIQDSSETALLPNCWNTLDRYQFLNSLEDELRNNGYISLPGSSSFESIFIKSKRKSTPIIWIKNYYDLSFLLKELYGSLSSDIVAAAVALIYKGVEGKFFKPSSLKSAKGGFGNPEKKMKQLVESVRSRLRR